MSEEGASQEEEKFEEKPKRRSRKKKEVVKLEVRSNKKNSSQVTLIAKQNYKLSSGTFVHKGDACVVKQEYADVLLKQTNAFEIAPHQLNNN